MGILFSLKRNKNICLLTCLVKIFMLIYIYIYIYIYRFAFIYSRFINIHSDFKL